MANIRRIDNVSIMGESPNLYLSFTMSELAVDGAIIRSGIRKSRQVLDSETDLVLAILSIKDTLSTDENAVI